MRILIFTFCMLLVPHPDLSAWGFFAHKKINELAVYRLPGPLFQLYKPHLSELIERAVRPDQRRYVDPDEGIRHYMDAEAWSNLDSVPKNWNKAIEKFGLDSVKAHGIVPWHVELMCYRLRMAFEEFNMDKVIYLSAELGHYVGDLHVPLHTTRNYNGQLTGQHGIHGLWESRIPELFFDSMDPISERAAYMENIRSAIWEVYAQSHALVDSVLSVEMLLRETTNGGIIHATQQRGKVLNTTFSASYAADYQQKMNGMVERRLRASIQFLSSLWYTCWVDAGQPKKRHFDLQAIRSDSISSGDTVSKVWENRVKILGREEPSH